MDASRSCEPWVTRVAVAGAWYQLSKSEGGSDSSSLGVASPIFPQEDIVSIRIFGLCIIIPRPLGVQRHRL